MIKSFFNTRGENGQILVVVFAALGVMLFTLLFLIGGAQVYFQNSNYSLLSEKANVLAEAGVDKAIASLNKTGGDYTGETETALADGAYLVTVTSTDAATKVIESTGYMPNKNNPKAKRTIKITASRGVGVAFNYGLQVGEGGLELGNSNIVTGSIYSNGNIVSGSSNTITGDVWVASGLQPSSDQQTDCIGVNCQYFLFGKNVSGEDRLAVAQSFKPSSSGILNKVSIRIKKFGNPADITVRILQDKNGKPDKNAILTSGTLYSSLVTAEYDLIDVTFNSSPALSQDTPYWLMVESSFNPANYWSWQNDLAQSYPRGNPGWSDNWSVGNPTWNPINGDLSFLSFMGGSLTSIRADSNKMTVGGSVHANTIENVIIGQDAYYQTLITSTVSGVSHPGSADPPPKVFPISNANVADWKNQVDTAETTIVGDITSCVSTLGPVKIVGNVNFNSGCRVTVKSPIWITGNLTLNSNNILTLDSSYQGASGVIIVDGKIEMNSNNHLNGTGIGSSLLMALTAYDSRADGVSAIKVNSNGNSGVYYAATGIIEPGTGNSFKELTAWKIKLINNSEINYETGLSSSLFSSGPSGSYSLVKGTYQVK
ncbi:hypothetical protein A3C26_02245 [Candidatus Daviesbacteria bacterium RIFCSPHIGHO2_02_FULL_39_12]|uniref:Uncharacterized protein n=2 Tax=Candidatus Daviesiibacteriota TaxID=1752718 RepID=A0A1F5JA98_9BACT|nr:MAG: hypothetical protein A3C26_02245 [Candidatus Daviesbacteria bacterium RIFCSPHIGHO2_02_FULL_39_12]OGE71677.1 MAG: hypothetical protein A3H40_01555 [Candidatus Daviesbacteria bacterium RIFCSPLOWO2_02_FULL_38_15]